NADGTFSYLGTANYDSTDSFTYRAVDNHGTPSTNIATVSITITPVNDAPVIANVEAANLAYTEGDPAKAITSTLTVNDVDSANRTFGFQLTDGGAVNNLSNVATRGIAITPVNDAPVLAAIEAATLPYTENAPATAITSTMTVSDVDSANLVGATAQITGNY